MTVSKCPPALAGQFGLAGVMPTVTWAIPWFAATTSLAAQCAMCQWAKCAKRSSARSRVLRRAVKMRSGWYPPCTRCCITSSGTGRAGPLLLLHPRSGSESNHNPASPLQGQMWFFPHMSRSGRPTSRKINGCSGPWVCWSDRGSVCSQLLLTYLLLRSSFYFG